MRRLFHSDEPHGTSAAKETPQPSAVDAAAAQPGSTTDEWWQNAPPSPAPPVEAAPTAGRGAITAPLPQDVTASNLAPPAHDLETGATPERGLAFAALRDVGLVRAVNQDSIFGMLTTVPRSGVDTPVGVFVLADGMGGHQSGEIASRLAVNSVARVMLADLIVPALEETMTEPIQTLMTSAVETANRTIWEAAQAAGTDMGTTCTAALLLGHHVYLGHVGDSRAYLVVGDELRQLTVDHSAVGRLIQLGQLDSEAAREHPLRSQLYRTVGQIAEIAVDYEAHSTIGASHLLLCSDGLWGMIDERDMHAVIRTSRWPEDACRALIERANAAGGEDNISAIVVSLP